MSLFKFGNVLWSAEGLLTKLATYIVLFETSVQRLDLEVSKLLTWLHVIMEIGVEESRGKFLFIGMDDWW